MSILSPHILLVGNTGERVRHLDGFISNAGWSHAVANDSSAAVAALRKAHFDVVIADVEFSKGKERNLLQVLHKARLEQPVIIVSHDGSVKEALAVLREGARDFLQYPLDSDTLQRSVETVVSEERGSRAHHWQLHRANCFSCSYEFTAKDLVTEPFQLHLLEDLYAAGLVSFEEQLQIKLSFQEALTNSLDHGNLELRSEWKDEFNADGIDQYSLTKKKRLADSQYGERKIFLTIDYTDGVLQITIEDQGGGFIQKDAVPVLADESELLCYGRGLTIIRNGMDTVEYRKDGRVVEMRRLLKQG